MKNIHFLKGLRVILAILIFAPILLFFVDFSGKLPSEIHSLLHIQIVPAILSGMVGILIIQFLLALIFGRIYCSVICPAGVLQDIINRIFCIGKTKKKGTRRFHYHKPLNLVRYIILAATFISGALGALQLCLLLDPYSNFGRIAANLFRPVVIWGNNVLATLLMKMDLYSLYHITIGSVNKAGLISASVALGIFIGLTIWRGRLFCNTICPVGALLSLISRYSLFRVSFDASSCTSCGNCERACKAEAIDSKSMTVDSSRCVDCFNCLSTCPKGGLKYRLNRKAKTSKDKDSEESSINSRRAFLATGVTVASSLPVVSTLAFGQHKRRHGKDISDKPIVPPGGISLERFKDVCTGCQLCVVRCPSQVLQPAGLEYGFDYMLKPHVAYINSYCNYGCTVCSEICPNGAIQPLTKEAKATTQVGIAHFFKGRCVVNVDEKDCGACAEHCPTQAVHMVPFKGTLTIPQVNPDLCIGCGGCESICPVRPHRAIIIEANEIHQYVAKPEEETVKDIEVDDFGF